MKISVYIATSLDGFIARKDGSLDWLPPGSDGSEDYGYAEFMSTVDHIVMGRNSFEKVLTFGEWPYGKKVIVLTSRDLPLPPELVDKVEALHLSPRELIHEMDITRREGHLPRRRCHHPTLSTRRARGRNDDHHHPHSHW